MREPTQRRQLRPKTWMRSVRSRLSHIARAQHDQIGLLFAQAFIIEAESRYHTRSHVFNYDIRPSDEALRQLQAFHVLEIQRHAMLRIVKKGETSRPVKTYLTVLERRILKPKTIRALPRFDVNYSRAKVRQVLADARPRGVGAEFDDLDAGKRVFDLGLFCGQCRINKRLFSALPDFVFQDTHSS